MGIQVVRGVLNSDSELKCVHDALLGYLNQSPNADISMIRVGEYVIRIRVIDRAFQGLSLGQRQQKIWKVLDGIDEEILNGISQILTLTPDEATDPGWMYAFESKLEPSLH